MGTPNATGPRGFAGEAPDIGIIGLRPGRENFQGNERLGADGVANTDPGPFTHSKMQIGGEGTHHFDALGEGSVGEVARDVGRPAANGIARMIEGQTVGTFAHFGI